MKKIIAFLTFLLISIVFSGTVCFAESAGKLTVVPENGRVEGGQKNAVRIIYYGAEISGAFAELTYPADMITDPVMTESISGVKCEISNGTIKMIFAGNPENVNAVNELRICRLDFEVKDDVRPGSTLNFEFKNAAATVKINELPSTVIPETKSNPIIIVPNSDGCRLAALEIKGAVLTPEFSPYIRNYTVTVPSSVGSVNVEAVAQNPEATIDGLGVQSMYKRQRTITVTNPDGEKFEYNLTFTIENYRGYSSGKLWQFFCKNGFYISAAIVLIFVIMSIVIKGKNRVSKHDEQ